MTMNREASTMKDDKKIEILNEVVNEPGNQQIH